MKNNKLCLSNRQGFSAIAIVAAVAVIIIVGGIYYNSQKASEDAMVENDKMMQEEGAMRDDSMAEGDAMMEDKMEEDKMMEKDDAMMPAQDGSAVGGEEEMMNEGDSMMNDEENMMDNGDSMMKDYSISFSGYVIAGSEAKLIDFNQADYEKAIASDKLVALYFYANWCPICKKETAEALYPAFNELERTDIVGFRVNYNDNETDSDEKALAKEFGVAYQHTKVFVKDGQRILKSPESWDKNRYFEEIEKAL